MVQAEPLQVHQALPLAQLGHLIVVDKEATHLAGVGGGEANINTSPEEQSAGCGWRQHGHTGTHSLSGCAVPN